MRNDRDDKYEGSDNSEYHFSDEDHYEADADASKQASGDPDGMMQKTGKSKRLYISIAVFAVLIGVVFKMVSPTSTKPVTDITPQRVASATATESAQINAQTPPPTAMPAQSVTSPPAQQTPPPAVPAVAQQAQSITTGQAPAMPSQQPAAAAPTATEMMQQAMGQVTSAVQPAQQPVVVIQPPTPQQPQMQQPQMQPPQMQGQPQMPVPTAQSLNTPDMLPNQAAMPSAPASTTSPIMQSIDNASALEAAESKRMDTAAQAEYAKRLADFQSQNKNLQDQMQILNSRVALMESQMNQLVQTLTQQFQGVGPQSIPSIPMSNTPTSNVSQSPSSMPPSMMPGPSSSIEQSGSVPRIPYNVTAIIPGRAWLRSNTGDTLTVAEGDDIKGVGRVTKIDPYDGVIVIDVHGKSVSLSYGNGS